MILLIDNYDSFVYNLYQYLGEEGCAITVWRNDQFTLPDVKKLNPKGIVISPGPKTPDDAGLVLKVIETFSGQYPILGVCLGHQAIGQAFGIPVIKAPKPMHGKVSMISHQKKGLFMNLESPCPVGRYHSLILGEEEGKGLLEVTARALDDNSIMAVQHKEHQTFGIQFHLESVLSPFGKVVLQNFLQLLRV